MEQLYSYLIKNMITGNYEFTIPTKDEAVKFCKESNGLYMWTSLPVYEFKNGVRIRIFSNAP